ncbi:hypothetical protein BC829DRAFT_74524 [Chytridium lagenaria]|nr:hypothetical protein BC829DRAFT_74524 [Chytridium lagenaria]
MDAVAGVTAEANGEPVPQENLAQDPNVEIPHQPQQDLVVTEPPDDDAMIVDEEVVVPADVPLEAQPQPQDIEPQPEEPEEVNEPADQEDAPEVERPESTQDLFQPPPIPINRINHLKRSATEIEDKPESECTICSEAWTNFGPHRLCSLKCGHLFGEKCIMDWIQRSKKSFCPTCRAAARKQDLRRIYANSLVAVDSVTFDQNLQEKNRMKREVDILKKENERLRNDRERFLKELNVLRCPPVTLSEVIVVSAQCQARVCSYDSLNSRIYASTVKNGVHGLDVFSVGQASERTFLGVHSGTVRDCKYLPSYGLILSGSTDKTLCLSSSADGNDQIRITLPARVWSCSFDTGDENYVCAGLDNLGVQLFDIRKPLECVKSWSFPAMGRPGMPIHSLHYIESLNVIIGASLHTTFVLDAEGGKRMESGEVYRCIATEPRGRSCTSLSFSSKYQTYISTWRTSEGKTRHTAGAVAYHENIPSFQTSYDFLGHEQKAMSRSKVLSFRNQLAFAISDEQLPAATLYTVNEQSEVKKHKDFMVDPQSKMMDVVGMSEKLGVLTESKMYIWDTKSAPPIEVVESYEEPIPEINPIDAAAG